MTDRSRAVLEYVCSVIAGCRSEDITAVDRIAGGENHAVYSVSYQDPEGRLNEVVVRLGSGDPAELFRADREARVLSTVGGIAGPKLYDFSVGVPGLEGSAMCLQFIRGQQLDLSEVGPGDHQRLGGLVWWLHDQPVEDLQDWTPGHMGLFSYVEERWEEHLASRLSAVRDPLPGPLQRRLRRAVGLTSDAAEELKGLVQGDHSERLVLLHADISGANLLWAPNPVLIDWEYARLGDPADEIAYLFTQNNLRTNQQESFWRGYSTNMDPTQLNRIAERVRLWGPITILGSILWWLDAWSRKERTGAQPLSEPSLPRSADYYLNQAMLRLDRFDLVQGSERSHRPGEVPAVE